MNFMKDRILFDTNILVYAFDTHEPDKNRKAASLFMEVENGNITGVISNQIIGEFFFVITSKVRHKLPDIDAYAIVNDLIYSSRWEKVNYTHNTVGRAIEMCTKVNKPFWDTLIIETAIENGVKKIYTENVKDFTGLYDIKIINPLENIYTLRQG